MTPLRSLLLLTLSILPVAAQSWDNSGNSLLKGTWYFRNVVHSVADQYGDFFSVVGYGQMTFDGAGNYTLSGTVLDSYSGSGGTYSTTGTYTISASGFGFMSHPLNKALSATYTVYGSVSNGVFVGSSTEDGFNDLFVAARLDNANAGVSALKGSYTLAYFEPSGASYYFDPYYCYDAYWQMSPDGNGNLGTVSLRAYTGYNGTSAITQNITGVKYIFSNGAANMSFPTSSSNAITGSEYLYLSPDGNFVFGGSPYDFDFFVGVRNASSGAASLSGLHYQAGVALDDSTISSGYGTLSSYYGAYSASGGSVIGHQRMIDGFDTAAWNSNYTDAYTLKTDGSYQNSATYTQYMVGSGGYRVGLGMGPYLGIIADIPVSKFSGSGVFLDPTGVTNAASYTPFTSGIAPGELITLYGSNLAADTVVAPGTPFPTKLGGVQVLINNVAAPIYYVSAGQIAVIVPYATTASIAQIQVVNSGTGSNTVTVYTNTTVPGVFTANNNGLGYAAALHAADYSLVSASRPALAGEYISVYVTGLGTVTPSITDGAPGPLTPLSNTVNSIGVYLGGSAATISYAGLAPQLSGLYQINFQVPTGLTSGDNTLEVDGPDSYSAQALLPVGTGVSTSSTSPTTLLRRPHITQAQIANRAARSTTGLQPSRSLSLTNAQPLPARSQRVLLPN